MNLKMHFLFSVIIILISASIACSGSNNTPDIASDTEAKTGDDQELVVMVHNAFDIGEDVIKEFEDANEVKIIFLEAGSSGEALNRAILEKGNPSADLLYGIDNTFLGRALSEEIFIPYESALMENVPVHLVLDETFHVTPVNYGLVTLNYDKKFLSDANKTPPTRFEALVKTEWKDMLVVQNPSTSSPGLAFLISTVSYFGEDDDYDYIDFWQDLRENGVLVKDSWSDAYYTDFSKNGGDRPLIVSYSTSPAAEFFFSEIDISEPPTGNIIVDSGAFLQIEGIGILKGTDQESLAQKFIDFVLSERFQEDFPDKMFVYPVNQEAQTPDFFKFAPLPAPMHFTYVPAPYYLHGKLTGGTINEKREEWIDAWIQTVLR